MAKRLTGKSNLSELPLSNSVFYSSVDLSLIDRCHRCGDEYCSNECKEKAERNYHRILCTGGKPNHPLKELQDTWKKMHYPPEALSIMLIAQIYASILQKIDDGFTIKDATLDYDFLAKPDTDSNAICKFFSDKNYVDKLEKLYELIHQALFDSRLSDWFNLSKFKTLFGMVAFNALGIGTSSLDFYASKIHLLEDSQEKKQAEEALDIIYDLIQSHSGNFATCEGSGLYPIVSACNHSCKPNAVATFPNNNNVVTLIAKKDIEAGSEIYLCYLDQEKRLKSTKYRKIALKEFYGFDCKCTKCCPSLKLLSRDFRE